MLPEIKSDLDGLERLAASFYDASCDPESDTLNSISTKIRLAVMDIQNLRDELHNLNKKIWKASRDLNDFSLELAK